MTNVNFHFGLSCRPHHVLSYAVQYETQVKKLKFPQDLSQVPDVFVELMHKDKRLGYARFPVACPQDPSKLNRALYKNFQKEMFCPETGFPAAQWNRLERDPFGLDEDEFAGSLLFAISFEPEVDGTPLFNSLNSRKSILPSGEYPDTVRAPKLQHTCSHGQARRPLRSTAWHTRALSLVYAAHRTTRRNLSRSQRSRFRKHRNSCKKR